MPESERVQQARVQIERLRALFAANKTLEEAGAEVGISKSQAHRLAVLHDLPRGRRWQRRADPDVLSSEDVALLLRLACICQLLAKSTTVTDIGETLGISKSQIHRLLVLHRLPHRQRGLDPEKRQALEQRLAEADVRPAELARELGISKSTVSAEERKELDAVGDFRPKQLKKPIICPDPECRRQITIVPCPVCAARKERERLGLPE